MAKKSVVALASAEALARRQFLALVAAGGILSRRGGARAESAEAATAWAQTSHAKVRLIDGGPAEDGRRLIGVEMRLDPGFLTYWRTPGEAGVPPTADFTRSTNLASAELLFPAPGRFDEGGAEAFGYKGDVIFPVLALPRDSVSPIDLVMSLSFAVCGTMCLPAQAAASLRLIGDGRGPEGARAREALARVPVRQALGAPGPVGVVSAVPAPDGMGVIVTARGGDGAPQALFPEAPDPWFLQTVSQTATEPGVTRFDLRILGRPEGPGPQTLPLQLTLAGAQSAIEVRADLDVPARAP